MEHLSRLLIPPRPGSSTGIPVAARYLRQAGSRARRLLDNPAFIRLAKRPSVALAGRRHDRAWEVVSHMTKTAGLPQRQILSRDASRVLLLSGQSIPNALALPSPTTIP